MMNAPAWMIRARSRRFEPVRVSDLKQGTRVGVGQAQIESKFTAAWVIIRSIPRRGAVTDAADFAISGGQAAILSGEASGNEAGAEGLPGAARSLRLSSENGGRAHPAGAQHRHLPRQA